MNGLSLIVAESSVVASRVSSSQAAPESPAEPTESNVSEQEEEGSDLHFSLSSSVEYASSSLVFTI